jgi:hypothetical protein
MKSFRSFQDRLYQTVLRHDKYFCMIIACGSLLLQTVILAAADGFTWIFWLLVIFLAIGNILGALFGFAILRYIRRRYEKEFLNR